MSEKNTTLTVVLVILLIIVLFILIAVAGYGFYLWNKDDTDTTTHKTDTTSDDFRLPPSETAKDFIGYTLGTVTGSSLDYDTAKDIVSESIANGLDAESIPTMYCIQNGPDEIKIYSEEESGDNANVVISAKYGSTWDQMWKFGLSYDVNWQINSIECLKADNITK